MTRQGRIAIAVVLTSLAACTAAWAASETQITCTNPASGASWKIRIDYAHAKVDANDAHISDSEISWHDAGDGGNYTLDRKSGALTMVAPSSTGGYFLHDQCNLHKPG